MSKRYPVYVKRLRRLAFVMEQLVLIDPYCKGADIQYDEEQDAFIVSLENKYEDFQQIVSIDGLEDGESESLKEIMRRLFEAVLSIELEPEEPGEVEAEE